MFIHPRVLSILTTRRCTAACDHCCIGAGPKATAAIPIRRIHGLIEEASRIPSISRIVFTGGECFLLGRKLDDLVGDAHDRSFETRVITNGYWAVDASRARDRVRSLRAAGLDEMMISTGTFHAQFVRISRVIEAVRAAVEAGLRVWVSVEESDQSTFDEGALRRELAGELASRAVYLAHAPWIPDAAGRGRTKLTHARTNRNADADGPCDMIMTIISVTPDQALTACCGFPLEELPALNIGSVENCALDEVLARAHNDLFKMWLHVSGPAGIAEFVARYIPGYQLPSYASICQACTLLQRDAKALAVITAHAPEIAQDITRRFVASQRAKPVPISAA
jgi:hypothetical protein